MNTKPIIARVDLLLLPLGFSRRKMTWNRRLDPFVDVIDLQLSKTGDSITVNTGVLHPVVYQLCWGGEAPVFVEEPMCTVCARIGQLLDGKDLWWRDVRENQASEIAEQISTRVITFLERMHSIDALAKHLEESNVTKQKYPPPIIYLALLMWQKGDMAGASVLLKELRNQSVGAWKTRIDDIIERLPGLAI